MSKHRHTNHKTTISLPPDLQQFQFLNEYEAAKLTGRGVQTLRNDRTARRGIAYSKIGKSVRYSLADVLAFMKAHRITPGGEPS